MRKQIRTILLIFGTLTPFLLFTAGILVNRYQDKHFLSVNVTEADWKRDENLSDLIESNIHYYELQITNNNRNDIVNENIVMTFLEDSVIIKDCFFLDEDLHFLDSISNVKAEGQKILYTAGKLVKNKTCGLCAVLNRQINADSVFVKNLIHDVLAP